MSDDRKLWSISAEAGVLGSMILNPACIGLILPILNEKAFFKPEHQTIYNALIALFIGSNPIDAITLRTELKAINQLETVGGTEYIAKLLNSVPSKENALYYAGIVRGRQKYRDLIDMVGEIGKVPDEPIKVEEQLQKIQDLALGFEGEPSAEYFTIAECVEMLANKNSQPVIIKTGFRNIDNIIEGFTAGDLNIIAGRPSMGKTGLALQIALNTAKVGLSVIFFTLEMSELALTERAKLQTSPEELAKLDIIIHKGAHTPEQQIAFIKTRQQTNKVDIVFVEI